MIENPLRKSLAAAGIAAALVVGAAIPAHAATWAYPGAVYCSAQNAKTSTRIDASWHTGAIQHRAQGYGGYYYADFGGAFARSTDTKNWGWNDILSTRLGAVESGRTIVWATVSCG